MTLSGADPENSEGSLVTVAMTIYWERAPVEMPTLHSGNSFLS